MMGGGEKAENEISDIERIPAIFAIQKIDRLKPKTWPK
jgi:hypothetical protein